MSLSVTEDVPSSDFEDPNRNTVELDEAIGDHCYWKEIKGNGCKYYRNLVTNRYLGEDRYSPKKCTFRKVWILFKKKRSKNKQVAMASLCF